MTTPKKEEKKVFVHEKKPLVVVGPSGVGKGTMLRKLFAEFPERFSFCVSHTTRKPRKGEIHGVNYYFVEKEEMKHDIEEGLFVEHATFAGNMYGTSFWSLSNVEASGKIPVLEVDLQGALQLHEKKGLDPIFCFIKPPSYDELERRLKGRGTETPEKVEKRLRQAKTEIDFIESERSYFFHLVLVNDNLEEAFGRFKSNITEHYPHLEKKKY